MQPEMRIHEQNTHEREAEHFSFIMREYIAVLGGGGCMGCRKVWTTADTFAYTRNGS
jgi:hypothetical protein